MLFLLIGLGVESPWAASDKIEWHSYESGMARSRFEKKKVFLYFHADWCGYCVEMDRKTFKDQAVIATLNRNFIPIRVDAERELAVVAMYRVKGEGFPLPYFVFLFDTGEKIAHGAGFITADRMMKALNAIMSASDAK